MTRLKKRGIVRLIAEPLEKWLISIRASFSDLFLDFFGSQRIQDAILVWEKICA